MSSIEIPDIHQLLADEGTLHLDGPQSAADVTAAVNQALDAVKQAYRVTYAHFGGDSDNETVDDLDMAANILIGIADDLK